MSRFAFIISSLILLATSHLAASPFTLYSSRANNFMGFTNPNIINGCITTDNRTTADNIILCDSALSSYKFQITLRIANLHNSENKSYAVSDNKGKAQKVANPSWGVVFNYISPQNYCALILKANNSNPYDILDKRSLTCTLLRIADGKHEVLASQSITDNVDLYQGSNLISIIGNQSNLSVKIGKTELKQIFSANIDITPGSKAGIFTGPGSKTAVERFIIKHEQDPAAVLNTAWTENRIAKHIAKSSDPNEGIWQYLDRIIDEKQLKLGGRYKLALIATPSGYDIIYISGAEVNATKWQTGMIKGRLIKTPFPNNYDLIWYDALFAPFSTDVNATIDGSSIITFNFPVHNTQLRFVKQQK